jgi:hypothetical protein
VDLPRGPPWAYHNQLPVVFPGIVMNVDIYTPMKSQLADLNLHSAA